MNKTSMTQNKRNRILGWSEDEMRVIYNMAGKVRMELIAAEVNKVGRGARTLKQVKDKANRMGFSVVVAA